MITIKTGPISKRSKRLLEEANRHINYALRGIEHLSVEEFERLVATCETEDLRFELGGRLDDLRHLHRAINWHIGARS